jgi:hypothetical protein
MGALPLPPESHKFTATEDEWCAFIMMGDIREIASPRFARLVNLAHAEGLLGPMLAGDQEAVQRRASQFLDALCARIHSEYPSTPIQSSMTVVNCEWRSGQIPNTATGVGRGEDWRSLWISFR